MSNLAKQLAGGLGKGVEVRPLKSKSLISDPSSKSKKLPEEKQDSSLKDQLLQRAMAFGSSKGLTTAIREADEAGRPACGKGQRDVAEQVAPGGSVPCGHGEPMDLESPGRFRRLFSSRIRHVFRSIRRAAASPSTRVAQRTARTASMIDRNWHQPWYHGMAVWPLLSQSSRAHRVS